MSHDEDWLVLANTDAECIDEDIGSLLDEYLDGTLSCEEVETFAMHLKQCAACVVSLANELSIIAAIAEEENFANEAAPNALLAT